jgi:hypothetical protein
VFPRLGSRWFRADSDARSCEGKSSRRRLRCSESLAVIPSRRVTALSLNATLDARPAGKTSDFPDELLLLIYTLDTVLLLTTVTTVVAVVLLSVRERIRDYGIFRRSASYPGRSPPPRRGQAQTFSSHRYAVPISISTTFARASGSPPKSRPGSRR